MVVESVVEVEMVVVEVAGLEVVVVEVGRGDECCRGSRVGLWTSDASWQGEQEQNDCAKLGLTRDARRIWQGWLCGCVIRSLSSSGRASQLFQGGQIPQWGRFGGRPLLRCVALCARLLSSRNVPSCVAPGAESVRRVDAQMRDVAGVPRMTRDTLLCVCLGGVKALSLGGKLYRLCSVGGIQPRRLLHGACRTHKCEGAVVCLFV